MTTEKGDKTGNKEGQGGRQGGHNDQQEGRKEGRQKITEGRQDAHRYKTGDKERMKGDNGKGGHQQ